MSFFDDAISSIGRDLAQTAVQAATDATGYDVGGTLNALFGNKQAVGGADLAQLSIDVGSSNMDPNAIAQLQTSIGQQQSDMTALGGKVDAIAQEISQIQQETKAIQDMLQKIDQLILYTDWEDISNTIVPIAGDIDSTYQHYALLLAKYGTIDHQSVGEFVTSIINAYGGPSAGIATISDLIVDDGQSKGVLQLWSNMVSALVAAGQIDYRHAVAQYVSYYRKLAYVQLQATNLLMEAYNYNADNPGPGDPTSAANAWQTYQDALMAQEPAFMTWLTPIIAAGVLPSSPQGAPFWGFGSITAATQLNPSVQQLPSSTALAPTAYYEPSSIYAGAEAFLATLRVTAATDRRIVVHMLFDDSHAVTDVLSAAVPTLDHGDATVAPSTQQDLGLTSIAEGDAILDHNYISGGIRLKRFVYEFASDGTTPIGDGSYVLTDLNGTNGLVPILTYAGQYEGVEVPFMDAGPLGYALSVSPTTPFAFMNFVAYVLPIQAPGAMG